MVNIPMFLQELLAMDARASTLQPMHLISLVAAMPLFLGALLSDWAYGRTEQIQWTNFALSLIHI